MKQNTRIAKIYNKAMTLNQQNNLQKTIEFLEEIEAKAGCVRMNFDTYMGPPGLGTPQAAPNLPLGTPRAWNPWPPLEVIWLPITDC